MPTRDVLAGSYEQRLLPVMPPKATSQTSSANAAQTLTITPPTGRRVVLYLVEAYTSAGSCTLNIDSPNATLAYQGQSSGVTTTPWLFEPRTPYVFDPTDAVLIELTAAGASNTSTINVFYSVL